jgi:hypothetical protein
VIGEIVKLFSKKTNSKKHKEFGNSLAKRISKFPSSKRSDYVWKLDANIGRTKKAADRDELIADFEGWEAEIENLRNSKKKRIKLVMASWIQSYSTNCFVEEPRRRLVMFFVEPSRV